MSYAITMRIRTSTKNILIASFVIGFIFLVYVAWVSMGRPADVSRGVSVNNTHAIAPSTTSALNAPPEEERLAIMKLGKGTFNASVESSAAAPKLVSEWADSGGGLVINGAYFNEDYTPSGLLIIDKKRIGTRKFDYDKSAALVIKDGDVSIVNLKKEPRTRLESFDYVLQSFPLLIDEGNNTIGVDSQKKARRSAIGIDAVGNVYVIVSDSGDLSLYEFAEEIVKTGISFAKVLNLDGGPSTGVYSNWNKERVAIDSYTKVSSVVRFRKKS